MTPIQQFYEACLLIIEDKTMSIPDSIFLGIVYISLEVGLSHLFPWQIFVKFPYLHQEMKDQSEDFLGRSTTSSALIKVCCTRRKCLCLLYLSVVLNRNLIFLCQSGSSFFFLQISHTSLQKWLLTKNKFPWIAKVDSRHFQKAPFFRHSSACHHHISI